MQFAQDARKRKWVLRILSTQVDLVIGIRWEERPSFPEFVWSIRGPVVRWFMFGFQGFWSLSGSSPSLIYPPLCLTIPAGMHRVRAHLVRLRRRHLFSDHRRAERRRERRHGSVGHRQVRRRGEEAAEPPGVWEARRWSSPQDHRPLHARAGDAAIFQPAQARGLSRYLRSSRRLVLRPSVNMPVQFILFT